MAETVAAPVEVKYEPFPDKVVNPPPASAAEEKVEYPPPVPTVAAEKQLETKPVDSETLAAPPLPPVDKIPPEPLEKKPIKGSHDRDIALAEVDKEKRSSFIKAWEESEKTKVVNKTQKKLSVVAAWENSKKAALEAQLKKIEEQLERKKAEYAEKISNKIASVHKQAEEKRATVEAQRAEEILKAEEVAAKYRATGTRPKKLLGCF